MSTMEAVLKPDGRISCQSLLEETEEEEKGNINGNYQFERNMSYKKAIDKAKKVFPEMFAAKRNKSEHNIQIGPKENEAIELDEFLVPEDKKMPTFEALGQISSNSEERKEIIICTAERISVPSQYKKELSETESSNSSKSSNSNYSLEDSSVEKKEFELSEVERGLLYVLFRPGRLGV